MIVKSMAVIRLCPAPDPVCVCVLVFFFRTPGKMAERTAFGLWKYAHYFQFVNEKEKNITVKCTLCVGEKLLSTAKKDLIRFVIIFV